MKLPGRLRWWHLYLILLALSQLWLLVRSPAPRTDPGQRSVEVARQTAAGPADGRPVRIAYREAGSGDAVIYLHGSPGSGRDSRGLSPHVAAEFRMLAPDLPGFGGSTRWVPDFGIKAHARYVLALMDELEIERAHFVGHSMGSGVAFHVAELAPDRVRSITAYAGIGVQEGEGSGDYHFEHLKYAAGYALLVVAPEVVPHFGLLGRRAGRHAFIRNFWDTDQRPLRAVLEGLQQPLLILQGRNDPLVPVWAAEEHHRIVEHSELVMLDASHFLVFTRDGSARLAREILPFLRRSGDPDAVASRRTVDHSGVARAAGPLPTELRLERGIGPWLQIGILVVATFVSEDLTCISAGLLARQQQLDLFVAIFGCFLGIFVTDVGLWLLGRVVGRRVLGWGWVARRVRPARVDRFGTKFDRHLGKAVIASRFLPGTRVPMYVGAGIVSKRPIAFTGWLAIAAAIWTPLLVVLAMLFGPVVARPFETLVGVGWLSWIAAALLLFVLLRVGLMAMSWRGRVRLAAAVSRLWRWEFWPAWLFYLPVLPWIAFLAVRHRGIATPTAANPAFPHGGFVGESKSAILDLLPAEWIVPSLAVAPGEAAARLERLRRHVEGNGWTFPMIFKPDEGQRGVGLRRVRDWSGVEAYLETNPGAILAQPYDPGPLEAGVFYYRMPGEPHGRIFSITDKRFPVAVGDGRSTLEELILRDSRLRMQAGLFEDRHGTELERVPEAGERIPLAVAGNHCQGTLFRDGSHLMTAELERAVDGIALGVDGFYFGRFDVRYADEESFKAGRDFRIVELNGVTSESTNIYDPSWSLLSAYRTLCKQWSLAFRIGRANRSRGHRTSSLAELIRTARAHYRSLPPARVAD